MIALTPRLPAVAARTVGCAAVVALLTLTGCTSGKHSASGSGASAAPSTPAASAAATRWWSNAAVKAGSTIDPAHPTAAAADLHASRSDYCGMLKDTLEDQSALKKLTADSPTLSLGAEAFVAEIQKVAPAPVDADWARVGPVLAGLVTKGIPSDASSASSAIGSSQNLADLNAIASDAKSNCGLDLSKALG